MAHPKAEQRRGFFFYAHFQKYTTNLFQIKEENLWLSSIRLSRFFRRSLSPSVPVSQCGVLSTSWKATATTTPALTLWVMIQGLVQTLLVRLPMAYFMSIQPNASLTKIGLAAPVSTTVGVVLNIAFYMYLNRAEQRKQRTAA